jgi:hypothetical protein
MNQEKTRIVREEFGRTAVWLFFSLLGWSLAVNSSPDVSVSLPVFFGAVLATAVGMSLVVVAVRLRTGRELTGGTESKDLLLTATTFGVGCYLVWSYLTASWTALTWVLALVCAATVAVRVARPSVFDIHPSEN